jgi:hypothetical protein
MGPQSRDIPNSGNFGTPNSGNFRTSIWESQEKMSFECEPRGEAQSIL